MGQLPFELRAHEPVGNAIENRTWRPVAQRLVQPLLVIKAQPAANASARLRNRAIGFDEHVLVLQATPQPLDEDVVQKATLAIHADPDPTAFQLIKETHAGELHALIGVENLGLTMSGDR